MGDTLALLAAPLQVQVGVPCTAGLVLSFSRAGWPVER